MREIGVNQEKLTQFVAALLEELAGEKSQAAMWFYSPLTLPVTAESIGTASPFAGSGGMLAGHGYLMSLGREQARDMGSFLSNDIEAISALVHMEVEVGSELQFRSYDNFAVAIAGPGLDLPWLQGLAGRGIISADFAA